MRVDPSKSGDRFGKLVILNIIPGGGKGFSRIAECVCDCGNKCRAHLGRMRKGSKKSCGCVTGGRPVNPIKSIHLREYDVWATMIQRCENPNSKSYPLYGGRGIKICKRWRESFKNFYRDMGPRPHGAARTFSIERINNNGPYEPGNCRWATYEEQSKNKTSSHFLTLGDETMILQDWANRLHVTPNTILWRIKFGWPLEKALTQPSRFSVNNSDHPYTKHGRGD